MSKPFLIMGHCKCYSPIMVGRGCMACMKPIGKTAISRRVAMFIAAGLYRRRLPQEQHPNRKQRRK